MAHFAQCSTLPHSISPFQWESPKYEVRSRGIWLWLVCVGANGVASRGLARISCHLAAGYQRVCGPHELHCLSKKDRFSLSNHKFYCLCGHNDFCQETQGFSFMKATMSETVKKQLCTLI